MGLGISGAAVARALVQRGYDVVVADDDPGQAVRTRASELVPLGVTVVTEPDGSTLDDLVRSADLVVPSPGVPPRHPVFSAAGAHGVAVVGEVELASRWTDRPLVAVTGTNGKTTVTGLITDMLVSSGMAGKAVVGSIVLIMCILLSVRLV